MTTPMIVLLLAAAAVTLLVGLIVVAVAQSLNKTGTPTAAQIAAQAAAALAAHASGASPAAAAPTGKHGRTPKSAKAFVSSVPASRHVAHKHLTHKNKAEKATAKNGVDTAEAKQKQTRNAFTGFAAIGGFVAIAGGVIGFIADFSDKDITPEISELTAGALHGTMVNARNKDPIVLIIPGSGPTDRDGNNPLGVNADAYRMLADRLIQERISTVRVDKRGMFASAGAGDPNAVTADIYAADIHAWIDAIKDKRGPGSGCVFLLGHSEGALMVSRAAAGRRDVCGVILVAGMGRPMGAVIREQLASNPANAPILDEALAALSEIEAGRHVDVAGMTPALLPLFAPAAQDYLISVINLDPVEILRAANKEALIIQGDRDLQVSVADARLLDAVRKTDLRIIEGMNHVLKAAPEDRAGNLATYAEPGLPLAKDLVRRIRRFVKDND